MTMTLAEPYRDLANASRWYLNSKDNPKALTTYADALRAVQRFEKGIMPELSGLYIHVLMPPADYHDTEIVTNESPEELGIERWTRAANRLLACPLFLVWKATKVQVALPSTRVPPSVQAFRDFFSDATTIQEAKLDALFVEIEPLTYEPRVNEAAMALLNYVGQPARLISW